MNQKTGLLLLNVGTPRSPSTSDVRSYLAEFLMDPYIIAIPKILRWLLVHGIILRVRPAKSAHAYQQIWTSRGSPLLFHTRDLAQALQRTLGPPFSVKIAMRYGDPTPHQALTDFQNEGIRKILAVPLFPQNADATYRSAIEAVQSCRLFGNFEVQFTRPFYKENFYIHPLASTALAATKTFKPDHWLLSFHGLPIKQDGNYSTECRHTADLLSKQLELAPQNWSLSFQSRLGRAEWLKPYTDEVIADLAKRGVRKLAVVCPSFVADCLETLEEIGMRSREVFLGNGGSEFLLVPCLNSQPDWVQGLSDYLKNLLHTKDTSARFHEL